MASFIVGALGAPDAAGDRLVDVAKQHLAVIAIHQVGPAIARGAITVDGRSGTINQRVAPDDTLVVIGALQVAKTTGESGYVPHLFMLALTSGDAGLVARLEALEAAGDLSVA